MLRHKIGVATPLRPIQVATSKRGRDTVSPAKPKARSRPPERPSQVATPTPCCDLPSGSITLIRSRPQSGVATSVPSRPGRDINSMSRPSFQHSQNKRGRDLKTRSRHQIHSVLLRRKNPRSPSLRPTATQPGRDTTSWSRPHAQPN